MTLQDNFYKYCEEGNLLLVKECLKQGADVNADNGWAIALASLNYHLKVVKELIKAGADVNADDNRAIKYASMYNYTEIVKLLKNTN